MSTKTRRLGFARNDKARYLWLLDRVTSALIASDGTKIFDLKLALPPARTITDSIDLARRPYSEGQAVTACVVKVSRNRSRVTTTACEPVPVDGYHEFEFGLHREPRNRFRWHVTERSTGASITNHCPTREAALAKLRQRLSKYSPERLRQVIESFRESAFERERTKHGAGDSSARDT